MDTHQTECFNLQFITHRNDRYNYLQGAEMALRGGCRWIQLRMKDATDSECGAVAQQLLPLCRQFGAVFIIDDRVELVKTTGADGVHLGKNDMHPREARQILGSGFIIGGTCNTMDDVRRVAPHVDYIGCGPFRYTTTKANLAPVLGLQGYKDIIWQMRSNGINTPVVAIGGITAADTGSVLATGVNGIALSGSILNAEDPVAETRKIMDIIYSHPLRSWLRGTE